MSARPSGAPPGLPKCFLHPCLLLLLREEAGYGYDLVVRLKELGLEDDSAAVYRALRTLEKRRVVSSYWCTSTTGPARRMYRLTPTGNDQLQTSVEGVIETQQAIERFFCRHALANSRPSLSEPAGASVPPAVRRLLGTAGRGADEGRSGPVR